MKYVEQSGPGSRLVLTRQTGEANFFQNIHQMQMQENKYVIVKRRFQIVQTQANPPSPDVGAGGAASSASLWERGGQCKEDEDGHGASVAGDDDLDDDEKLCQSDGHSVEIQENSVTAGFSYKNFSADACASGGLPSSNQPISVWPARHLARCLATRRVKSACRYGFVGGRNLRIFEQ